MQYKSEKCFLNVNGTLIQIKKLTPVHTSASDKPRQTDVLPATADRPVKNHQEK